MAGLRHLVPTYATRSHPGDLAATRPPALGGQRLTAQSCTGDEAQPVYSGLLRPYWHAFSPPEGSDRTRRVSPSKHRGALWSCKLQKAYRSPPSSQVQFIDASSGPPPDRSACSAASGPSSRKRDRFLQSASTTLSGLARCSHVFFSHPSPVRCDGILDCGFRRPLGLLLAAGW